MGMLRIAASPQNQTNAQVWKYHGRIFTQEALSNSVRECSNEPGSDYHLIGFQIPQMPGVILIPLPSLSLFYSMKKPRKSVTSSHVSDGRKTVFGCPGAQSSI